MVNRQTLPRCQNLAHSNKLCKPFITYTDACHGDCVDTGRSTPGFVTMMAGGAIGWYSKLQTIVALSTTEAEYMAAIHPPMNEHLYISKVR